MSLYQKLLWFLGFQTGDTISAQLARQKKRLGWKWFILPGGTILFTIALLAGWIVLTVHIANFKLPEDMPKDIVKK